MAHEIYYTSCPRGLRPMSRGLCTVGATDGIPPALWERLEALSGYRHHFDPEDPRNPVAHAHWILYIGGREYHVLSRISDSGFDYTRRNNSFAHHLAVDPGERPAAGPAWLLAQPGVMAQRWDGQVEPIHRAMPLPQGDAPPAPCDAWGRAAGDPGWAGVLAEAFADHPSRPMHLIYAPEQAPLMLELVAEAIALVPPGQRWNVTFHTLFTSMPGNVQCNWRCCLAGTHAAAAARSAGSALLDLSAPQSLGRAPDGPWMQRARTGSAAPIRPEPIATVARLNSRAGTMRKPPPIPIAGETPVPELPDLADLPALAPPPAPVPIHLTEPAPAGTAAARNLMILYLLACAAVGVGIWLLVLATRPSADPEPLPVHVDRPPDPATQETRASPPVTQSTESGVAIVKTPTTDTRPIAPTTTQRTVDPPPVTRPAAQPVVLARSLERMGSGGGLGSKPQIIPVPRDAIHPLDDAARLAIVFPIGQPEYAYHDANIVGRLWCEPEATTAAGPGLSLFWKDTSGAGGKVRILTMTLEKAQPQIKIAWNTSAMLRGPEIQSVAFWVLQNSQVLAASAAGEPVGRLFFKPVELAGVKLLAGSPAIQLPCDLPPGLLPRTSVAAPEGWSGTCEAEWDSKDNGRKAPENASHVIRLRPDGAAEPAFAVTVFPGWTKADTDLGARRKTLLAAQEKAAGELALVTAELQRIDTDARADLDPLEKNVSEFQALQKLSNAELEARGITRPYIQACLKNLREQIQARAERARGAKAELEPRRMEAERARAEADRAVEAMGKLAGFDLALELGEGLRVGRLRFELSSR